MLLFLVTSIYTASSTRSVVSVSGEGYGMKNPKNQRNCVTNERLLPLPYVLFFANANASVLPALYRRHASSPFASLLFPALKINNCTI